MTRASDKSVECSGIARKVSTLIRVTLLLLAAALGVGGCTTLQVHWTRGDSVRPYLGTSLAVHKARKVWEAADRDHGYYGMLQFYVADVPACAVVDTLTLPYDWYQQRRRMSRGQGGLRER